MNLTYVKGLSFSITMEEFEVYTLNVVPEGSDFKLCFSGHKNNFNDSKDFPILYVDEYELEDIIKDFCTYIECCETNIQGYVFSYYQGDRELLNLYRRIMDEVESEVFHMESEWG